MNNITLNFEDIMIIGAELLLIIILFFLTNKIIQFVFNRSNAISFLQKYQEQATKLKRNAQAINLFASVILGLILVAYNSYLIYDNINILKHTLDLINTIPPNFWSQLALAIIQIILLISITRFILPKIENLLHRAQEQVKIYKDIQADKQTIERFFESLNIILENATILFTIAFGTQLLSFPDIVPKWLFIIFKIYLIISIGILLAKAAGWINDTGIALTIKYTKGTFVGEIYENLWSLSKLIERSLEYIIYIITATLVINELNLSPVLVQYGTSLAQILYIALLSRVFVEVAYIVVDKLFLHRTTEMTEVHWQQRLTLVPLAKTLSQYTIYLMAFLVALWFLNVDTGPIITALGGTVLVIGLGAQSVISDWVAGAFIIFENIYLVGDYIETEDAEGIVEVIDVRTTQVRSPDGQLYILRNGEINNVVNFSKRYVYARVNVDVAYSSNLDKVYAIIKETGHKLEKIDDDTLEATIVEGVKAFGSSSIIIRTITKAKPGRHREVAFYLRKLLKEAFEANNIEIPFPQVVLNFKNLDRILDTNLDLPQMLIQQINDKFELPSLLQPQQEQIND